MGRTRYDTIHHTDPSPAAHRVGRVPQFAGLPLSAPEFLTRYRHYDYLNRLDDDTFPGAAEEPGDSWTVTVVGTTPVASISDDLVPARLIITNSATDDDSWNGQETAASGAGEQWALRAGKKLYFRTSFLLTDANNNLATVQQVELFLGLSITDNAVIPGASDFIGFNKVDGTGLVEFVAGKNAGGAGALHDGRVISTGVTLTAAKAGTAEANLTTLEFLVDGTNTVYVWANGSHVASQVDAVNLPDDENLCASIALKNGEGVAKIMHLTEFFVAMER